MPPEKADPALLWDMLEAAREACVFAERQTYDDFINNKLLRSAIERKIEIIGEAARGVSKAFRQAHPEIPWTGIIAQRHVLAHEYGEIKYEKIWHVASVRIPALIAMLEPLVPPPPV